MGCFFDLTNAYFEGQAKANPKAKRGVIFRDDEDREAFLNRLGGILLESSTPCYAWSLLGNHIV